MPVKPLPTGHYGLGHIIESLASSAQSVWWNSMVTRPEIRLVAFESSSRAVGRGRCIQLPTRCIRPWFGLYTIG